MFILGALFPRLEGPVEASIQGVKANLSSREEIERDDLREEVRELGHRLELTAEAIEGKVMDVDRVLPPDARVVIEDSGSVTSRADLRGTAELVREGMASAIIGGNYTACGNCRTILPGEPSDTPEDKRTPCPNCGSTARAFHLSLSN
jgi:hypothetical protein